MNIGLISAEIFMEILEANPNYPLETTDMYGNTSESSLYFLCLCFPISVFLLAFINGNSELCKLALRDGVCMGVMNNQGQSVFNFSTPTQQLLFGLLGQQ